MAWNATSHAHDAEQTLAAQAKVIQQNQDGITQRMTQAEAANAQLQGDLNVVTDKLKITQDQLTSARTQVKQERADYTKKLSDVQSTLATKASTDDVKALGTDVNGVKTDLDTTKGNLEQLRGEHGELIARNHEELEQLKRMGERDYYEFTLTSKGQKERVGPMQVEFRGASAQEAPVHRCPLRGRYASREEEPIRQRANLPVHQRIEATARNGGQLGRRQEDRWLLECTQGCGNLREG